jgi:uncharacterized protein (DUF2147 family)
MKMPTLFLACLYLPAAVDALASMNSIEGTWLSGDGDGLVEVRLVDGDLTATILGSPNSDPDRPRTDVHNPDPGLRNRPLVGLRIFAGFRHDGDGEWSGGTIYDPNSGNTYRCTLRLVDENTLKVRGYIGIPLIGRTETWTRQRD